MKKLELPLKNGRRLNSLNKVRYISIVRVLGLFLVLTYHLFQDILPGGFLGVDIFFTFSGYLITSLMISNLENANNFDFLRYIKRRFLRIFPALLFSIFFTLPFVALISSDFSANLDRQIAAALGFVTNYFEINSGNSYESQLVPNLYTHTWSLAIEAHYYILWGIYMTIISFIVSRLKNNKIKLVKILLMANSIILFLISYFHMQRLFFNSDNKSIAYFSTMAHIYPFFVGSVFGVLFGINLVTKISQWLKNKIRLCKIHITIFIPIIMMAIIFICHKTNFDNKLTYKYGFLTISLLSAGLIFLLRMLDELLDKSRKESKLIEHIAFISYPMYLFHWPFFIIFSNIFNSNLISATVTIIFSYVFSVLFAYNIEPIFYRASHTKSKIFNKLGKYIIVGTVFFGFICLFINANILINKSDISELEKEQMVASVIQNIDKIENLKQGLNDPDIGFDQVQKVENIQNSQKLSDFGNKITVIGDSVTLGARKKLKETFENSHIDAKGNRSIADGYDLIKNMHDSNILGKYVVIALGTNGCENWKSIIDKIIEEFSNSYRLIFVTPYDGYWNESWKSYKTTQYLKELKESSTLITIADWAENISSHSDLLGSDKTHIGGNQVAIDLFVETIAKAISEADLKS